VAFDEVRGGSLDERRAFMLEAGRAGLRGRAPDGRGIAEVARAIVAIAAQGLCRQHCCGQRGEDERVWLAPLEERAAAARSPADEALEAFRRGPDALRQILRVA
jgi:glutamate--cysteine ligase